MNNLQQALINSGLTTEMPKERVRKPREYKCRKCGHPMTIIEGTNTMACTNCKNYFIFDRKEN